MEHALEYFGVATGLVYVVLEIMQHRAMWVVGFLTSFVYIFVFFFSKFYAGMSVNIYYVCISAYAFLLWKKENGEDEEGPTQIVYRHMTYTMGASIAVALTLLWSFLYNILALFTDSPVPCGDAFTTAMSIIATWMLARRVLEHWWFWVVINVVSAILYYQRELYPTCFLFLCYGILAVVGWFNWKKKGDAQEV